MYRHPFSAVKNIFLTEVFSPCIVPVLQELVEIRATEVLPAVENISWRSSSCHQDHIGKFVSTSYNRFTLGWRILTRHFLQGGRLIKCPLLSVPFSLTFRVICVFLLRMHSVLAFGSPLSGLQDATVALANALIHQQEITGYLSKYSQHHRI